MDIYIYISIYIYHYIIIFPGVTPCYSSGADLQPSSISFGAALSACQRCGRWQEVAVFSGGTGATGIASIGI